MTTNNMTSKSNKHIKPLASDKIFCAVDETKFLGEGSFGVVQRGYHLTHGLVAIKCSGSIWADEREELQKRTIKEVELQQKSSHENVVRVHGWSEWLNVVAIVLEYLPAGNLMSMLCNRDVTIHHLLRLRICFDIAKGLSYIHKQNVIHGDIKPENILLTKNLHAKIADFGSAQTMITEESYEEEDIIENRAHTAMYAPPEVQMFPMSEAFPFHDTYSYAVTMLTVLGRDIYNFFMLMHVLSAQVLFCHPPVFSPLRDAICEEALSCSAEDAKIINVMVEVMDECWNPNPTDRPPMQEVEKNLEDAIKKHDFSIIKQHAIDAAREMKIKKK